MKENKYKAWDKRINKIRPIEEINFDRMEVSFNDSGEDTKYDYGLIGSEIILMQFIGLLDKNGKEIYEGHICKGEFPAGKGFISGQGEVVYNVDQACYCLKSKEASIPLMCFTKGVEIIGNVFENKEILEGKEK